MATLDVFCEIPCLTENSKIFSGTSLRKKWFKNADSRIIGAYLQKFIQYNKNSFDFLGVHPSIIGTDLNAALQFRTTNYIGSIPLRSPDTGKQIGDFVVTPKFHGTDRYLEYIEILNILKRDISPETIDSLPLASGRNFRPPLYLEIVKFINSLSKLVCTHWTKFERTEKMLNEPRGQVNWNKYSTTQYKAENLLRFPCGLNIQSDYHSEYAQIRYAFDLCKAELLSHRTPQSIKHSLLSKLILIEERLYFHKPQKTSIINIKSSDPTLVKDVKTFANNILCNNLINSTAWRVDFSNVFEKFVQYIFEGCAKEAGGKILSNYKMGGSNNHHLSWTIKYLEPDAIYRKDGLMVMIDAKYKSNLYNKYDLNDFLKDDHRRDLHQILGYSSFNTAQIKFSFLCYPSSSLELHTETYTNPINHTMNKVLILGIPMEASIVSEATQYLTGVFTQITAT